MSTTRPLTVDEWLAINDEILALTRAGIPLEQGLASLAGERRGRARAASREILTRLQAGESFERIVADSSHFPPVYRAVVEAGQKSGNLAVALEGLSTTLRDSVEIRRTLVAAAIYPALLVFIWSLVTTFFLTKLWPVIANTRTDFGVRSSLPIQLLDRLSESADLWGMVTIGFSLAVFIVIVCQVLLGYAVIPFHKWIPFVKRFERYRSLTVFTDLLALLIENDVPLPDALELAGTLDERQTLLDSSKKAAASLRAGKTLGADGGLPSWIRWILGSRLPKPQLVSSLREYAKSYSRQAEQFRDTLVNFCPVVFSIVFGATIVVTYCLAVFGPFAELLYRLCQPET